MTWTYHNDPAFRVAPGRFFVAIAEAQTPNELIAFRAEMRRHMRFTVVYSRLAGITDPFQLPSGRWRIACVGEPYRDWSFGELLGQLRHLGLTGLAVVIADTHRGGYLGELGLAWADFWDTFEGSIALPLAQVGSGILDTVAGAADALESTGEGLREGLPGLGAGVGDALAGVGEAARSAGDGLRGLGALTRLSPTMTAILVLAGAGLAFGMYTGAVRFRIR